MDGDDRVGYGGPHSAAEPVRRLCPGAAAIAACGAGWYSGYRAAAEAMVHIEHLYEPEEEDAAWYAEKFQAYDRMWKCMEAFYRRLKRAPASAAGRHHQAVNRGDQCRNSQKKPLEFVQLASLTPLCRVI